MWLEKNKNFIELIATLDQKSGSYIKSYGDKLDLKYNFHSALSGGGDRVPRGWVPRQPTA